MNDKKRVEWIDYHGLSRWLFGLVSGLCVGIAFGAFVPGLFDDIWTIVLLLGFGLVLGLVSGLLSIRTLEEK